MDRTEPINRSVTPKRWSMLWPAILVGLAAAILIGWLAYRTPRGLALLHALPARIQELNTEQQRIGQIILDNYIEYRGNARNWSAVYFGGLFFSAACAALSGLIIKLEFFLKSELLKKDVAATLAMISALLVTLSTAGGFNQRWLANRLAAARMESLGYEFIAANLKDDLGYFSTRIQAISYQRNVEISGGEDNAPTRAVK